MALLIITMFNMREWEVKTKIKKKIYQSKNTLDRIKPYLSDMINSHKAQGKKWKIYSDNKIIERTTQGEFKIQLTMVINFISSIPNSYKPRTMRTKSDDIVVIMGSESDEVIEELFKSF